MYHFTVDVALAVAEGLEEERGGEQEEGEQHLGRGQGRCLHPDLGPVWPLAPQFQVSSYHH